MAERVSTVTGLATVEVVTVVVMAAVMVAAVAAVAAAAANSSFCLCTPEWMLMIPVAFRRLQ